MVVIDTILNPPRDYAVTDAPRPERRCFRKCKALSTMRDIPLSVVLTFPLPNYQHPQTRGGALVVVNFIFIILVLLAVGLRFYTRIAVKRWFGSDDVWIGLALLMTIGMTAVVLLANTRYGWNRHVWDIPVDLLTNSGIIAFVAKIAFTLAATFTRISLLCFYYRLIKDGSVKWFKRLLHVSVAFVVSVCIVFLALTIWQCSPIEAYWVFPPIKDSKCLDEGTVTLAAGVINCVADLLVTVLPIPIVMQLQMPIRQRIGVIFLLSLGFIVTNAGVVRTYFIWKSLVKSYDETWFAYPLWIAAAVEIDLAVICACAPALKPLLSSFHGSSIASLGSKIGQKWNSSRSDRSRSRLDSREHSPNNTGNDALRAHLSDTQLLESAARHGTVPHSTSSHHAGAAWDRDVEAGNARERDIDHEHAAGLGSVGTAEKRPLRLQITKRQSFEMKQWVPDPSTKERDAVPMTWPASRQPGPVPRSLSGEQRDGER
ncbi:hypothetical protein B0A49_02522 [Cryomyces minteri]|uniref:Rhodopsin domain-containing protein n=1 Tax=Cryomyces minteri TaxID=331657 RepID=A0A4U0XQE9_9PEZI|nr:hypothetical protein B0A49_02522 [Cryomyces minteri]